MEEKELNTSPQDAQDVTATTPETQPQTDSAVAAEEATAAEASDELSDADKLAQAEAEIAELKDKCVTFVHSEEEAEGEEEMREAYEGHGGKELNLKDLLAHNSTNGYESI